MNLAISWHVMGFQDAARSFTDTTRRQRHCAANGSNPMTTMREKYDGTKGKTAVAPECFPLVSDKLLMGSGGVEPPASAL
jgi:hypothetical protein